MKKHNRSTLISYTLFMASAVILASVVYFALNIQVLRDWNLTLPDGEIHAGDTIVVASTYTKLRQTSTDSTSTRSIECEAQHGIFVSFPLNKAVANRAPGKTGTGIVVKIPEKMSAINALPDTCHICVSLRYPVLPLRTVPYFRCSSDFTLLPKQSASSATEPVSATQTSQPQASSVSPAQSLGSAQVSSSTNNTPNTVSSQPEIPQPASEIPPTTPAPQPSLIQRILKPITNLLGGL